MSPTPSRTALPIDELSDKEQREYRVNLPAKHPTATKPPVAELMTPEIGGPASAPNAMMLINIPTFLPMSDGSPNSMTGLGVSAKNEPVAYLRKTDEQTNPRKTMGGRTHP